MAGLPQTAILNYDPLMYSTGQISASLAAMNRTVDDYDSMAKREIIKAKQEKAMMYVQRLFFYLSSASLFCITASLDSIQRFAHNDYCSLGVCKSSVRTMQSYVPNLNG